MLQCVTLLRRGKDTRAPVKRGDHISFSSIGEFVSPLNMNTTETQI